MLEIVDQIRIINKPLWKQVILFMDTVLRESEINTKWEATKIFKPLMKIYKLMMKTCKMTYLKFRPQMIARKPIFLIPMRNLMTKTTKLVWLKYTYRKTPKFTQTTFNIENGLETQSIMVSILKSNNIYWTSTTIVSSKKLKELTSKKLQC